jgi:hypothetical protein
MDSDGLSLIILEKIRLNPLNWRLSTSNFQFSILISLVFKLAENDFKTLNSAARFLQHFFFT